MQDSEETMPTVQEPAGPFHAVVLETEKRPTRLTRLEIIDNTPASPSIFPTLGAPGTLTIFIGRKGTGAIDDVRAAIESGDKHLEKLKERFKGLKGNIAQNTDDLAQKIAAAPVFADIHYGDEVLNKGIFIPEGSELAISVLPYNGGRLISDGFTLVEHYQQGSDIELEALAVRVAPPLTAAEKAALAKVPADQEAYNVGPSIWCDTTWWDIAYLAVSVTFAVLCVVAPPSTDDHISEAVLAKLDPTASAQQLLTLRRNLLRDKLKK